MSFRVKASCLSQVSSHEYRVKVRLSLLSPVVKQVSSPQICDLSQVLSLKCPTSGNLSNISTITYSRGWRLGGSNKEFRRKY